LIQWIIIVKKSPFENTPRAYQTQGVMGRGTVRRRGDEQRDEVQATTTKAVDPAGPWFVTIRTRMWNTVLLLAPWWAYIAGTFLALTQLST
jgi:hypothetical protein